MTPTLFALLERLHGHLAVLGLAVLLHPVITLRRRRGLTPGMRWSVALAAALIAAPYAIGWAIYPSYRAHLKPALWRSSPAAALAFESKEHLAFFTLCLTLAGAALLLGGGRSPSARRVAAALLTAAWCCGALTAALGVAVAAISQPAW